MPLWFYNMPDWLIGTLMVGGCMAAGLGGHALRARGWRDTLPRRDHQMLIGLVALMTVFSLGLLGWCATTGWEASGRTHLAVQREAGTIGALGRSLSVMPQGESHLAREQLKAYTRAVIFKEWPAMQDGHASLATWDAFDTLFRSLADIQPASAGERALMPEVWTRINELLRLRHTRLESLQGAIPMALWAVTATSASLTLGLLSLLPTTRGHRVSIALISFVIGLGLFLALALDRPFCLSICAEPQPFEAALQRLERWDSKVAPVPASVPVL